MTAEQYAADLEEQLIKAGWEPDMAKHAARLYVGLDEPSYLSLVDRQQRDTQ